jgi:hypothetical protein
LFYDAGKHRKLVSAYSREYDMISDYDKGI